MCVAVWLAALGMPPPGVAQSLLDPRPEAEEREANTGSAANGSATDDTPLPPTLEERFNIPSAEAGGGQAPAETQRQPQPGAIPMSPGSGPGGMDPDALAAQIFGEGELRDAEPPVPLSDLVMRAVTGAGLFIVLLGTVAAAYRLFFEGKLKQDARKKPIEVAREGLIQVGAVSEEETDRIYAITISRVVREFLENELAIPATGQTTEEFLNGIVDDDRLDPQLVDALRDFLNWADLAKFAGQPLTRDQRRAMLETAETFIESTHERLAASLDADAMSAVEGRRIPLGGPLNTTAIITVVIGALLVVNFLYRIGSEFADSLLGESAMSILIVVCGFVGLIHAVTTILAASGIFARKPWAGPLAKAMLVAAIGLPALNMIASPDLADLRFSSISIAILLSTLIAAIPALLLLRTLRRHEHRIAARVPDRKPTATA